MIVQLATLSSATACRLVEAALAQAAREGLGIAVCVADMQGHPLATARMDGVTPPILGFAEDKAYTAATMRRATTEFAERMASSPALTLGLSTRQRLLAWGGGLPIVHAGTVIGGIGISGAKDHQDIACAEAALTAVGLDWKI